METPLASHPAPSGIPNILYAGNIGAGQGLDRIVPALAKEVAGKIHFTIIGDGGQRGALEDALKQENVENVTLLPPVPRKVLHDHYAQADGLFLQEFVCPGLFARKAFSRSVPGTSNSAYSPVHSSTR